MLKKGNKLNWSTVLTQRSLNQEWMQSQSPFLAPQRSLGMSAFGQGLSLANVCFSELDTTNTFSVCVSSCR